jgi:hypothetical protein
MLKIGDFSRLSQLFGELFRDFPGSAARGPCFAIWHEDEHKDQDVDAEACVPIDEKYQSPPSGPIREILSPLRRPGAPG